MSISTRSLFYYGYEVTASNNALDFSEGGAELQATLTIGSYTLERLCDEVERALNDAGALTYTVTPNRTTRVITIAAGANFTLKVTTGSRNATTGYTLIGYTGADRTGAATYAANVASGSSYATQFVPQSYVASTDNKSAVSGVVNRSASGRIEVVSFGEERFVELNLMFITDINVGTGSPIRYNATGKANANSLMEFLISKQTVEFIPNEAVPGTYENILLESTPEDSNGLKYKLKEMIGKQLPGFYETGLLKFRVDND